MRLSVPSWLVPGGWLENLRLAAELGWAEGAELLFFSYDEEAEALLAEELPGIRSLASRLSLSVHLPDPLDASVYGLLEAVDGFAASYVLHPPASFALYGAATGAAQGAGSGRASEPRASMEESRLESWAEIVSGLRTRYGNRFYLEYTGREAFSLAEAVLPGLPICADSGRLLLDGEDPAAWIAERGERVAEIHLHGLLDGKDHQPLSGEEEWLKRLIPVLEAMDARVELEVFSLAGVKASREALELAQAQARLQGADGQGLFGADPRAQGGLP